MTGSSNTSENTAPAPHPDAVQPENYLRYVAPGVQYKSLSANFVVVAFLGGVILTAYLNVLFNFFSGDDFVHLVWLKQAVHQPELILRNFHSSWLDGTTTRFYRPLISVFMVTDYLTWGTNGTGFHLTNILFLIAASISLFFIVKRLSPGAEAKGVFGWALLGSLLFGLYPIHPEAVAWITGRVDAIVAAFYLGSMLLYLRWRSAGGRWSYFFSMVCMTLALLSKEMAITIPATLAWYELTIGCESEKRNLLSRILLAVRNTWPFWAQLAVYFGVRRMALGTFVGGYDDSLLFISNWANFQYGWLHGLRMLFIPANRELMGGHSIWVLAWQAALIPGIVLSLWSLRTSSQRRRILFLAGWFVLAMAPVYKIFAIADDLEGSRLAYLATAPLTCLLTIGYADLVRTIRNKQSSQRQLVQLCTAIVLSLIMPMAGYAILIKNNSAWREAGFSSNAIRSSLQRFYATTPGDPQVLILNLPDQIHGAYTCRNALLGMTKTPQLSRDVENCLMINSVEKILPFGFLKLSLAENRDKVHVLTWNETTQGLLPISLPDPHGTPPKPFEMSNHNLGEALEENDETCTVTVDGTG
ncbi:MAG: hypothetical protein ACRD3W_19610, partial [Terriglobales bacterium]